jgi:hypothetical protein
MKKGIGMNVLCYRITEDDNGKRLKTEIEATVPEEKRELYDSFEALVERLRTSLKNSFIAVLFAPDRKELGRLLEIGALLQDIPVILILPDRDRKTVQSGHSLFPRFLSYVDSDFKDVGAVLCKMRSRFYMN